ncbi:MAG: glycosyltransferase family 9 protein [bacterium]
MPGIPETGIRKTEEIQKNRHQNLYKNYQPMDHFLICHRGALGDFILTWPVLYTLRKSLPDLPFMGIGRPEYMRLAVSLGLLDSFCHAESSELAGFFSGQSVPPVFGSPRGAVLWLAEGQAVAGLLKKSGASLPVAVIPPFPRKRMHVSRYHWLAVQSYFPAVEGMYPCSLCFFPGERKSHYALIHPGSGSQAKNYQPRVYRELADELRQQGMADVRFVLGPVETQDGRTAQYLAGERVEMPEDVETLARLQVGASLYIGNDSGASHLAGALGTTTVALYKVTDPEVWGVMGERVTNLKAESEDSALWQVREYMRKAGNRTCLTMCIGVHHQGDYHARGNKKTEEKIPSETST